MCENDWEKVASYVGAPGGTPSAAASVSTKCLATKYSNLYRNFGVHVYSIIK